MFALSRLEIVSKNNEQLEHIKTDHYNINDHVTVIKPTQAAPKYNATENVTYAREYSNNHHLDDGDKEVNSQDNLEV
jgi:hypothetical protein